MLPNSLIRNQAMKEVLAQIRAEDKNTDYLDIGPVIIFLVVPYISAGEQSDEYARDLAGGWTRFRIIQETP